MDSNHQQLLDAQRAHDLRSTRMRRAVMSALLSAALVGVVSTLGFTSMAAQVGWFVPAALVALSSLTWALYELDIRSLRLQRDSLETRVEQTLDELQTTRASLDQAHGELARMARVDELTGLANDVAFGEALRDEWRRAARLEAPLALVLVDVDEFKAFDAALGGAAAQACLRTIGEAVGRSARRAGDLAVRRGGCRFAVIFANTTREAATQLARALVARVAGTAMAHPASRISDHVTVSVGVAALVPGTNDAPELLVCDAEDALNVARVAGGNRVETAWRPART